MGTLITVAMFLLVTTACGSSGDGKVDERTEPLRTYAKGDPRAVHVTDLNDQVGPDTKSVTIPVDASAMLVRFDCVGDGEKFDVDISNLGNGGWNCNSIGDYGWSSGSTDTKGEPVVLKGDKMTIKVTVGDDVHWSLSVDLAQDEATYNRLSGHDS